MSTSPTGSSKDGGKTVEFTGDMLDCGSESTVPTRWVTTRVSADENKVEMYVTRGDKEDKAMELVSKK